MTDRDPTAPQATSEHVMTRESPVRVHGDSLLLWCPACEDVHRISIAGPSPWAWNGDETTPTITPSIKVEGVQWPDGWTFHNPRHLVAGGQPTVCHSVISAGVWQFLPDSTHVLSGQNVPLTVEAGS